MNRALLICLLASSVSLGARVLSADLPPEPSAGGPQVLHLPVLERRAEQGILRPVPVSAELPDELTLHARRVLVHYRLWGEPDWITIELRRQGARFEGAIPCLEISTVTGDLRYYIRVHDQEGRVIATGASRAKPYLVTIKHDTALAASTERVAKCPDPADCPRGLPGCPSEQVVEIACQSDRDCEGELRCGWRGFCERIDRAKSRLSLSIEQDLGVIATSNACSVPAQENEGYACYRADGIQYAGSPVLTNEPLHVARGPMRVVVGFERLVYFDTSIGVRAGWILGGTGPTPRGGTPLVPLSVSARATHWFGQDLFAHSGLRPFAFITGGYAMTDLKSRVHVREDPTARVYQADNDLEQTLVVWKRSGDGFVGAGAGLELAFSTRRAANFELIILSSFPFGALVIAPSAGGSVAF